MSKNKVMLYILLAFCILLVIFSIVLVIFEIRKILPIILMFVLGITIALGMYFLIKSIMKQQDNKKRRVKIRNNA